MILGSVLRSASPPDPEDDDKGDGRQPNKADNISGNPTIAATVSNMKLLPDRLRERATGKFPELPSVVSGSKQTIQARHGTAAFVPKGHTIKVINTYGKQVVDLWGFALHAPPTKDEWEADNSEEANAQEEREKDEHQDRQSDRSRHLDNVEEQDEKADSKGEEDGQEVETTTKASPDTSPNRDESGTSIDENETKGHDEPELQDSEQDTAVAEASDSEDGAASQQKDADLPSTEDTTEQAEDSIKQDVPDDDQSEANIESETPAQKDDSKEDTSDQQSQATDKTKTDPSSTEEAPARGWSSYIPSVRGRSKQPKSQDKTEKDEQIKSAKKNEAPPPAEAKGWGSYLPSLPRIGRNEQQEKKEVPSEEQTWSSYIPSGQGFSTYLPDKKALSSFASMHQRDPSKSVAEQLFDFSRTPVGAAGLSVATGSGYASSIYAAYSAYSTVSGQGANQPGMEFLSVSHTRTSTKHISPQVEDVLVTNLRAPLLTLVENYGDGVHDTLMAACDPNRYRELGVENWEEHGSCAENLVLSLKELNSQVGLKGSKAIGADVTVNSTPAPLNLFMNVSSTDKGELSFGPPKNKRGAYVKFRAERDVVIVMSACPQDKTDINGGKPMVAHFVVEEPTDADKLAADSRAAEAQDIITNDLAASSQVKSQQPKSLASLSRNASHTAGRPATSRQQSGRAPPRKLDRIPTSRKSSSQMSVPMKESQRVEPSDPPTPRAPSETSQRPPRPTPRPGRNKPRKLERRTPAAASRG